MKFLIMQSMSLINTLSSNISGEEMHLPRPPGPDSAEPMTILFQYAPLETNTVYNKI